MSYRKHLHIVPREKFEQVASFNYDTIEELCNEHQTAKIEVFDELNLDLFYEITGDFEYTPRLLHREDIRELIKEYQKLFVNNADEGMKRKEYQVSFDWYIKKYFEKLLEEDSLKPIGCGFFLLDYFYIVDLYNNFSDVDSVAIITHG